METRARKILDTTYNYGAAERFIDLKADFVRFLRQKYHVKDIKTIDPEAIAERYNLKGFVFGNYVTQEERYFYLFKISGQLEYLAKAKGKTDLGKGVLIIAFGSEGKGHSNAHYNPASQLINLNRGGKQFYKDFLKGENSFVHEYGHFLDFWQANKVDYLPTKFFASENNNPNRENTKTLLFSDVVDLVISDKEYYNNLNSDYLQKRIEIFARLFEVVVTNYIREKYKGSELYFDRNYRESIYYPQSKIKEYDLEHDIIAILKTV
jgi:hypothetical protein